MNQGVGNESLFIFEFKQRVKDCYLQEWTESLSLSLSLSLCVCVSVCVFVCLCVCVCAESRTSLLRFSIIPR